MPRSVTLAQSQCLTDELLAELVDGKLSPEALARAHQHAAGCQDCRELLVTVALGGLQLEESREHPSAPPTLGWTPPAEFDEFRLVRPLGRGAMGIVYLAHDRALDRQVAVKFIAAHQPNARARERFQTEARAIARLQHPNVVTVFRTGEVYSHPYIVSEFLAGYSLAQLAFPLSWRRALGLGIGLARGLAAAHRQGVLHRDLKPDNVFLTAEGEVKLLDFGLAELIDPTAPSGPGGSRAAAGTPRYMAPELFKGASATSRSDLYSLGLILYELCSGTLPPRHWPELPPREGDPVVPGPSGPPGQRLEAPLSERVPGIAPEFASIIERCLRAEPEERFASAETLRAELERLEPLHELEVLPAGNPYRGLAPFEAEHRALFFGRDADIRAVIERLRRQPLVLVAGDSGVGKSSLCRAGVLPRAARGAIDEYRDFSILTMEPGRHPVTALAAALAPVLGQPESELVARLTESQEWLGPELRKTYQKGRGLLLFVDQLEELVTLSEPAQAARFAQLLGELAMPTAGVRLLLTVRGDFFARVGALPGLGDTIERALYLLRPLTPEGVREAIVGPARSRGVSFESEELIRTLTEATTRGAGSLPLLQFTLAELWERRDAAKGQISQAVLNELGGVAGALSRHADAVLARLDQGGQQTARRLFGRLMTAEGTRCERSEEELATLSGNARTVLQALVAGRLLHARTTEGRTSYEIAHEALFEDWSTMRRWLGEDAGQRALQQRVETAGAEWERSGRAMELLWSGRPLLESRALDPAALGPRTREFLRASERAVRRRRQLLWAAALFFLLIVGSAYFGPRVLAWVELQRFASAQLRAAQSAYDRGLAQDRQASKSREDALALFDDKVAGDSAEQVARWAQAEEGWAQTLDVLKMARDAYAEATLALDSILARDPGHPEAYPFLVRVLRARIELAERFHHDDERAGLVERFKQLTAHDEPQQAWLMAPAELELVTEPSGARVELTRYEEESGRLTRKSVPELGPLGSTPVSRLVLPAGSYHLRITRQGRAPVELPLFLERGQHERIELWLPTPERVPQDYVYIPPGCFFTGSAEPEVVRQEVLQSAPLHQKCFRDGYLIGRYEVTLREWLDYLDDLPDREAPRRLLENSQADSSSRALMLRKSPEGYWVFSLKLSREKETVVLQARAGELFLYPRRNHRRAQDWLRFPLANVSAKDLQGYLSWLRSTGRLPGARLCTEWEWTRAARGADARRYPHGNRLQPDDANIDVTYGRVDDDFGPDEVGAHPASMSPFGVHDMAGNVLEITQAGTPAPEPGSIIQLGGAWYYGALTASIPSRQAGTPSQRDSRVGARVCADLLPAGGD